MTDELTKLAELRDRGVLTDAEFELQKAHLLRAEPTEASAGAGFANAPTPPSSVRAGFLATTGGKAIAAAGVGIAAVVIILAMSAGSGRPSAYDSRTASAFAPTGSQVATAAQAQPSDRGATAPDTGELPSGKYTCYASGRYTFSDLHITGPHSYTVEPGGSGSFNYANGALTFLSGPYAGAYSRMVDDHTIGLSTAGSQNLGTQCGLEK